MTQAEFDFVVNHTVESIVAYLMEDENLTMQEAFDRVYNSDTYLKLRNKSTGLYRYSPAYVYEYLKR